MMAWQLGVYKCELCGNIVEGLHTGGGTLTCCGQAMTHVLENTVDASHEKHVPQIEKTAMGYLVKVGSVSHPMDEAHYIEWIELVADGKSYVQFLQPGDAPQSEFCVLGTNIWARAYCNLHGLWRS